MENAFDFKSSTLRKDKDHFMRSLVFIKGPEKDAALVEISTAALQ
jgi:hypothetical protein